ncbi:unnamed protein product [Toxocara canis]|uniref:Secreted protein n=1 Tax=Toxocara canis TaxID=6265 RepID=A0A183VE22_TOXCA|nr:unnamed protein product [Toxocara canis]
MGAVLIVFLLAAVGTGVVYKMGYLDKVIAKAQDNLAGGRSPSRCGVNEVSKPEAVYITLRTMRLCKHPVLLISRQCPQSEEFNAELVSSWSNSG